MQRQSILYLVAGANGSGKTTLALEILKDMPELHFLNTDEIASEIGDSVGLRAGKLLVEQFEKLLNTNQSILLESTISGKQHLNAINRAKQAGYLITMFYVFLDLVQLNISRIQNRVALGGHNVPETDIRRRYTRSLANFWETLKYVDRWELYQNNGTDLEKIALGNEHKEVLNEVIFTQFKGLTNVN